MDLTPYVADLRRELAVAAEAGGEDARMFADRLIAALEPAVRLTLLDALSAAADEITRDLAPGSVEVRLRGRDLSFAVTPPPGAPPAADVERPGATEPEESASARINFRLPEHLKVRIEAAAGRDGTSVNTWLVRAAAAAVEPERRRSSHSSWSGQQYRGWVR